MEKIISLILIAVFLLSAFSVYAAPSWPTEYNLNGLERQFRPSDKYVSEQNPPTFTWSAVKGAKAYDIIVCRDKELKEIAYSQYGLKDNLCGFNLVFEEKVHKFKRKKRV